MDTAAVLFFLAFIITIMLGSTAFFFANLRTDHHIRVNLHREHLADREARRHIALTRLEANQQGNYPIHFREDTLEFIAPPPGNRPFADNIYFQPGAGANRPDKITVMKPTTPNEIRINAYNSQRVLGEVDTNYMERLTPAPDIAEISPPAAERSFEPKPAEKTISDDEIREFLAEARARGEGKTATLKALGAKPGDNPQWRYLGSVWDELV